MSEPLWRPSRDRINASNVKAFIDAVNGRYGTAIADYDGLHAFSVARAADFWTTLKDFSGAIAETWGETVIADADKIPGARFFPDARLNFAENLLRQRDDSDTLVFWGEDQVKRRMSWRELTDAVSVMAQALRGMGIAPGDRVAAFMPNMPETIVGILAATSLGAVWSSCSPDFGVQGVVDRFGQTEPRFLLAVEGYHYNGKAHDCLEKLAEIVAQLPSVEKTAVVPYTREVADISGVRDAVWLGDFLAPYPAGEIDFVQMPFNAPLYIMFSSGTTGAPKCIVHGAGGTLLQHLKEHKLHCDIKPGERLFYFTTCGWMMWNWLVSGLAAEATLLLYDGAPFYPDGNILFDFAVAEDMHVFGTSAKYIDALAKGGYAPKDTHDLAKVRLMTSTGSPLAPESFDYVYEWIKADIHLASISGGTDIISCFMLGNPTGPVWRGEIQARGLGMATAVFDDAGHAVTGEKGELVCTNAFPSMPLGFWKDDDGARYHDAYFAKFPNVWCHGDFVALTEHGGFVIYGRSDAVLNPGGVRIGTAEIYRQVEQLDEVVEAIVIGQEWDNDVRVVLFVVLREGLGLDDALTDKIRRQIRANCTPRHVPARVVQVADIPRTKSGKITELAVRDVVHGRPIKNKEALANPEALELFANLPQLAE